ncbi:MAG TPA: hypothetical protein RMF84_18735 [Polyangiaceae bacterium LLY-WYZ-14_1]|nr:hypothetical protein [Polyangiaceae bacterium LLY-WYZ-14_1]
MGSLRQRRGEGRAPTRRLTPALLAEDLAAAAARDRGLARDVAEGRLDLPRVHGLPDPEVVSALTAVRGLGVWSAEIYLLFALGRRDVFPAGDLGVRAALDRLGLVRGGRPDEDRARQVGSQRFAPYRSAVTLFLWHALDAPPLAPRR